MELCRPPRFILKSGSYFSVNPKLHPERGGEEQADGCDQHRKKAAGNNQTQVCSVELVAFDSRGANGECQAEHYQKTGGPDLPDPEYGRHEAENEGDKHAGCGVRCVELQIGVGKAD